MRPPAVGVAILSGWLLQLPGSVVAQPVSGAEAGVPRVMQFNGTFRPASGQPPAPVEIVTFAIYAEETGGTALWRETQNVTIASGGDYTVVLGATHSEGLPLDVFASGQAHWLGVRVNRPDESEQPRIRIMSVPYALRASDAETLGGRPASAYLLAEPSGAATTPPIDRNTVGTPNTNSSTTLSATTHWIPVSVDNAGGLGNSSMFQAGTAVGLGTTTPVDALHVAFNDPNGVMTGYAVQNKSNSATAYSGMLFYDQNGALGQFQGFNNATHEYRINNIAAGGSINFMTGNLSKFLVGSNGDIDIATGRIKKGGLRFLGDYELGNTGVGLRALNSISTSAAATNTAVGAGALQSLTTGSGNVALGESALSSIVTGTSNVAIGYAALNGATGDSNVALGSGAGQNQIGSVNIYIGSAGGSNTGNTNMYFGFATGQSRNESNTIRIGDNFNYYSRIFLGAVRGSTTGNADAVPVVIDSAGQLGTINSSRRFKEDIQEMDDASSGLMKLRPVTYRYKQAYADGSKPIDYGLIAEEVEAVYPDLVTHSKDGQVETVQYQKINAMLLNEVQKQHRTLEEQRRQIETERTEIELLKARLAALEAHRR